MTTTKKDNPTIWCYEDVCEMSVEYDLNYAGSILSKVNFTFQVKVMCRLSETDPLHPGTNKKKYFTSSDPHHDISKQPR